MIVDSAYDWESARVLPSVAVSRFMEDQSYHDCRCCGSGCVKGVGVSEGMKERDVGLRKNGGR